MLCILLLTAIFSVFFYRDCAYYYRMERKKIFALLKNICFTIVFITIFIFSTTLIYKRIQKKYFYPLTYSQIVFQFSKEYSLPPALIFAIIKTESSFDKNAVSKAGAKGLMQITDKTGEFIAKKMNASSFDLFDAKTSVEFGCYYLNYLKQKFPNIETTICAYNAGEGNVASWLKNPLYSTDGKTLKTIPFSETSAYLKKIKKNFAKYEKLYGNILDK